MAANTIIMARIIRAIALLLELCTAGTGRTAEVYTHKS